MVPKYTSALLYSFVLLGFSTSTRAQEAAPTSADAADHGVWRASAGINYSEGDYGDSRKTRVVSAPVAIKYARGGFSVRVSVPFVHIDGPGSLLDTPQGRDAGFGSSGSGFDDHGGSHDAAASSAGSSASTVSGADDTKPDDNGTGTSGGSGSGSGGSGGTGDTTGGGTGGSTGSGGTAGGGGTDDGTKPAAAAIAPAAAVVLPAASPGGSRSGIGDVSITMAYSFDLGAAFYADVSGRLKIPTASKARRLGTGRTDFTGGVDLVKDIGAASVYVGGRHKFIGKPTGLALRDVWGFGGGASYRLSRRVMLGADYDWQQSATPGGRPSSEITGWANVGLSRTVRMQVFAATGFSTNSADIAGGLSLSWRFD